MTALLVILAICIGGAAWLRRIVRKVSQAIREIPATDDDNLF